MQKTHEEYQDGESLAYKSGHGVEPGPVCWYEACMEDPNYWYIEQGKKVGMCFGHATAEVHTTGRYGRRERKDAT